jgi:tRNA(adenine34) deaminase
MQVLSDDHFMSLALKEAQTAFDADEVPVGAIIVCENKIIGKGYNLTERLNDVTAHAEMQAITAAASFLGSKYLLDCTLYVTLEPCVMCAGALYWSQISKIVIGAKDTKRGYSLISHQLLHPKTELVFGIKEKECSEILKTFFKNKR